jgi:hypothetical protein
MDVAVFLHLFLSSQLEALRYPSPRSPILCIKLQEFERLEALNAVEQNRPSRMAMTMEGGYNWFVIMSTVGL